MRVCRSSLIMILLIKFIATNFCRFFFFRFFSVARIPGEAVSYLFFYSYKYQSFDLHLCINRDLHHLF